MEYATPNKPKTAKIERNKSKRSNNVAVCSDTSEIELRLKSTTVSQKNALNKARLIEEVQCIFLKIFFISIIIRYSANLFILIHLYLQHLRMRTLVQTLKHYAHRLQKLLRF